MANTSGNAYGLTLLCPIKNGAQGNQSFSSLTRQALQDIDNELVSPLSKVPNTYLCRFYILNDVFFEGFPALDEHLESKYLVFSSNFHGDLDSYLEGFWTEAADTAKRIWQHCVAFDEVGDSSSFTSYIKKCQVETSLFFNGSSDTSLNEQLQALHVRQSFTEFVIDQQKSSALDLLDNFLGYLNDNLPDQEDGVRWQPGKDTI